METMPGLPELRGVEASHAIRAYASAVKRRKLNSSGAVWRFVVLSGVLAVCGSTQKMTFFVTSVPTGDGGNLGGLAGADAHCQKLAGAAGSRRTQWRA